MSNFKFNRESCLIILSGPSGCGKTSVARKLLTLEKNIATSISYTTREARPGEVDGHDYNFVSRSKFSEMMLTGKLLEYTEIHGNYYGTDKTILDEANELGHDLLFDIDATGAQTIKASAGSRCFSIFLFPPSISALSKRLHTRGQDSEVSIFRRLNNAKEDIAKAKNYDYVVVNSEIEIATAQIRTIIYAERLKRARILNLDEHIDKL